SWNIRIECSISALYVMAGRPLQGLDRPYYRYTIRMGNREVIESAILSMPWTATSEGPDLNQIDLQKYVGSSRQNFDGGKRLTH
ncbi:MAG: hypothetical protein P4L85_00545, partial [Paludisphaera borealis]|uniref:hypothetical protein n=1 Tax=Paludisphaera borealis TaxID=1387353 RepID=UPI002846573F